MVRCILGNLDIGITPSKKGSYFENQGRDKRRKTGTVPGLAANAQHASLKIPGIGASCRKTNAPTPEIMKSAVR
jgi:hypothetical protein